MSGLTILDYVGPSAAQWHIIIRGMRNSWESQDKSDSGYMPGCGLPSGDFYFGPNDAALALRLAGLGSDHGKYLRQIPVIVDIKAPGYFWREMDTYRVGVEASDITQNSTSMMHTLGKHEFTADMFYFDEDEDEDYISDLITILNKRRERWIAAQKRKGPDARAWRQLQQALPYSILYTRTVSLNYQVLRSIYHARKHHRLAEWRSFCHWITTLEHSELLTTEAK